MIACLAFSAEAASKRMRINRDDLVGTWIGLTSDELQMVRVTLDPDGTGWIGFSFLDNAPCILRLRSWVFDKGKVALGLDKSSARCPVDREFHGEVSGNALLVTMRGSGWSRSASLRREEKLAERWLRIKAEMSSSTP